MSDELLTATSEQMLTLLSDDRLRISNEQAAFAALQRWADAPEARCSESTLLGIARHIRFALLPSGFLQQTVRAWPALQGTAGQALLLDALVPALGGTLPAVRSGSLQAIGEWEVIDGTEEDNMSMLVQDDRVRFRREYEVGYGAAIGKKLLTTGRHQWTVIFPNGASRSTCLVGVAFADAHGDDHIERSVTVDLADGTQSPQTEGEYELAADWRETPVAGGTPVHVLLDMDERVLMLRVSDDGPMMAAYTGLPAEGVYPYVASGDGGDESIFYCF